MRLLSLLAALLGLLAARPARAQPDSLRAASQPVSAAIELAAPPVSAAGPVPAQVAPPDTVAAIHRLFARGRARRRLVVFGTLGVGGALAALGLFSKPATNDPLDVGLTRLFGITAGTVTAVTVGTALLSGARYSRQNEQRALTALQNHALPERVRRQLTPVYFRPKGPDGHR